MKILIISHLFPNKIRPLYGVFVKERAKYISRKVSLKIVAPVPYFPMADLLSRYRDTNKIESMEVIDDLSVFHPRYLLVPGLFKFSDGYLYYLSLNSFITDVVRDTSADLLDFQWGYPDAFAGVIWAKRLRKKLILTVRGNASICFFEKSLRKRMVLNSLRFVDHIVAVSNDLKQKLINNYNISDKKITVISNGINSCEFYKSGKDEARKICGLEPGKKYILSLSRLSFEKGIMYLLKAFASIMTDNLILLIGGDGAQKKQLQKLARDLNIHNNVCFVGGIPHEKTMHWYNASDVYCLPSLWEGCPNTIIEALACGTPVVSTLVGGIPDLVDSRVGYLVPPKDSDALARALESAIKRSWNYAEIAAIGQGNSWDNVADKTIEVYRNVLG